MRPEAGFSVLTAIFLLVVLAALAVIIASVTGIQQASSQLDVLGVRAYQSARLGMEWGARAVLDPGNTLNHNLASCSPVQLPPCPAASTNLPALAGSLSPFTVTVSCTQTADTTEGNRGVRVYALVATACNQPVAGACPNPAPGADYIERQLQAAVSKCKDSTATAPRCECG
jgi:MSHA biogenesis protein MshP